LRVQRYNILLNHQNFFALFYLLPAKNTINGYEFQLKNISYDYNPKILFTFAL
jgi:hypothetical protein